MSRFANFCTCRIPGSLVLTILILTPILAQATDAFVPVYHPGLEISRTSGDISIDGKIDDPGWIGAAKADNFAEHSPGDQTRPDVDTEVLITYDSNNLYVAWICYDDPSQVRASFCGRDQIFSDDYVILCLDTFGEATLAYEISTNPYGIPGDLLFSSSSGEDWTYDMIFESAARITEDGWIAEMAIPFTSIRFPGDNEQVWRVDFWRNRPRESRYQYSWAAYDRDESCWPCQWGTITGISDVKPGKGLELLPSVVAHHAGSRDDNGDFQNGDVESDVGLGITYDISSELTAEATINPDFSQVESDAAQIDVNSTFALFFPERRPFFQEGSDLFDTFFDAVYTRSINDPIFAAKMTGRKGNNSAAFLSARDQHSVIILPFEESSEYVENGESTVNILRARHDLGDQSHIGLIATNRRFDEGGSGTLAGLDGRVRLSPSNQVEFQYLTSFTEEVDRPELTPDLNDVGFDNGQFTQGLDGEEFYGHDMYTSFERNTSNSWFDFDYWQYSPTFRADSGFEPKNDRRISYVSGGYNFRFEDSKVFESMRPSLMAGKRWNYAGDQKSEYLHLTYETNLRTAQTNIHARFQIENEEFGGVQFEDIWIAHICAHSRPSGKISLGANYNYGHDFSRHELVMGKETRYGANCTLKPTERLTVGSSYTHLSSVDIDSDEELYSGFVSRSTLSYQFSREISTRLILQYNSFADSWEADPLIKYQLNPLSTFYLGSTRDYRDLNLADDGREGWALTDRQYFMKLQYLFQL